MRKVESRIWRTEFKDFLGFIDGKHLDFYEMCDLVVKCKAEGFAMEIDDKRDKGEFYFVFDGKRYSVVAENVKSEHRYGDGGEFEDKIFLKRQSKNILVSRYFRNYETYLDDSMDYNGIEVKDVYLLEEDLLGREIFSKLKCAT